jgi:hypothetical protein
MNTARPTLFTLDPAANTSNKSHKFRIEGRKDGADSIKAGSDA